MSSARSDDGPEGDTITVAVRCRPFNDRENALGSGSCVRLGRNSNGQPIAVIKDPASTKDDAERTFVFDYVYDSETKQESVYRELGLPVLENALSGFNGTIFAYGQTGSGKTHSMGGSPGDPGLIPRLNNELFSKIGEKQKPEHKFLVMCSFYEIYNEFIYDLLDSSTPSRGATSKKHNASLQIKEHPALGVYIKGLRSIACDSHEKLQQLMDQGNQSRTQGATHMNAGSSRSHSVFCITVHQKIVDATASTEKTVYASLNLVDLAGSERASRTGAEGKRLKEGANINKSLAALGNVINTLAENATSKKKKFVPYRNSKLTRVLQQSLGGNSKCSMLATLSPAEDSYLETLSTLNYANRAKCITVNATCNEEAALMDKLKDEVALLKAKLESLNNQGGEVNEQNRAEYENQIQEMDQIMKQTWEDKQKLSQEHEEELRRAEAKLSEERAQAKRHVQEERERRKKLLIEKEDPEMTLRDLEKLPQEQQIAWFQGIADIRRKREEMRRELMVLSVYCTSIEKEMARWVELEKANEENQSGYVRDFSTFLSQCQKTMETLAQQGHGLVSIEASVHRKKERLQADIKTFALSQKPGASMDKSIRETKDKFKQLDFKMNFPSKILARPPVRFIVDVFHEIVNTSDEWAALCNDESVDAIMESEESKIAWLSKLVSRIAFCLNENSARACPNNIAKGLVPEDTNNLLQGMGDCLVNLGSINFKTVEERIAQNERVPVVNKPVVKDVDVQVVVEPEALQMLFAHVGLENKKVLKQMEKESKKALSIKRTMKCLSFSLEKALAHNHNELSNGESKEVNREDMHTALKQCLDDILSKGENMAAYCDRIAWFESLGVGMSGLTDYVNATVQAGRNEAELTVSQLETELRKEKRKRQELENQLSGEEQQEGSSLQNELDLLEDKNTKLSQQVHSLQQELELSKGEANKVVQLNASIAQLQGELAVQTLENKSLEKRSNEQEESLKLVNEQLEAYKEEVAEHRTQLYDFQEQIEVLTEERDTAREKEEEYYSEITEKEEEMDRIKEGYVWATDKLNDTRDELADMRDECERWEETARTLTENAKHTPANEALTLENTAMRETLIHMYMTANPTAPRVANDISVKDLCLLVAGRQPALVRQPLEDAREFSKQIQSPIEEQYDNDFE